MATRRHERPMRTGAVTLVFLVAASSCLGNQEPCSDLREGDRLTIELVSPWEGDPGAESCFTPWGVSVGMTLEATVVRLVNSEPCRTGAAEIDGIENWTWSRISAGAGGSTITIRDAYDVESGKCSGRAFLTLRTRDEVDCEPTDETCSLSLEFDPSFDADDCPPYCSASFRVRVKRQK